MINKDNPEGDDSMTSEVKKLMKENEKLKSEIKDLELALKADNRRANNAEKQITILKAELKENQQVDMLFENFRNTIKKETKA